MASSRGVRSGWILRTEPDPSSNSMTYRCEKQDMLREFFLLTVDDGQSCSHTHTHKQFILTQSSGQTTDIVARPSFTQPDATVRTQDTETVWLSSSTGLRFALSEKCVIADILVFSLICSYFVFLTNVPYEQLYDTRPMRFTHLTLWFYQYTSIKIINIISLCIYTFFLKSLFINCH